MQALTLATLLSVIAGLLSTATIAGAECVLQGVVSGNPSCSSLGIGDAEIKIDPPAEGTFSAGGLEVTITDLDERSFDWTSSPGVDAVIVKGGPNANLYVCDPEGTAGNDFVAPSTCGGKPCGLSHVSFCHDEEADPCAGVVCDDGNACTADRCDPANGECVFDGAPLDGTPCQDGMACTSADGTSGNPDQCLQGECTGVPVSCGEGDLCDGGATCDPSSGECVGGTPVDCSGLDDACNDGVCDPATGTCSAQPKPDGTECQDGDACTSKDGTPGKPDQCTSGTCDGTVVDCDDADACTGTESCDPASGCLAGSPLDCDDGDACTADECDSSEGCVNRSIDVDPQFAVGDARAYGVSLVLLDEDVIEPTPDSDEENPYRALELPLDPLVRIALLEGSESESGDGIESVETTATAQAADVVVLDPGLGLGPNLVSAETIRVTSSSEASAIGSGSTSECVIENAVVLGQPLARVTEPVTIEQTIPLLGTTVTVKLCERVASGAAAGEPQPDGSGTSSSSLVVNGIHVTITGGSALEAVLGSTTLDLVVSHAESGAAVGIVCSIPPHVSGEAFVLGTSVDETLLDPDSTLVDGKVARVLLPSSGGGEDASLADVGPIGTDAGILAASNSALSHTEGTVGGEETASASHAQIEDLELLRVLPGGGALLTADLVRAECTADHSGEAGSTTAATTILGATLGGEDLCAALGLEPLCTPEPNTEIVSGFVLVRLNEQIDRSTETKSDVTVNAIHLFVLGEGNPLGLPVGADVIVASAHCDAGRGLGIVVDDPEEGGGGEGGDPLGELLESLGGGGSSNPLAILSGLLGTGLR